MSLDINLDTSIYRLRQRDILTLCVCGLLMLGVLMVSSAAMHVRAPAPEDHEGDAIAMYTQPVGWQWNERGMRHLGFAAVAVCVFFVVGHLDYSRLNAAPRNYKTNLIFWAMGLSLLASALVLVPGIGLEVNGARRWLPLGFIQVQPSEMFKWSTVLFLAWWLTHRPVNLGKFSGFVTTLLPIGLGCLLIVIQDFGTAVLIGLAALTMLLVSRVKTWHLLAIIPPALAAATWFIAHKEYRLRRMTAFLDPWAAPQAEGYHMIQSLMSFATGGLTGRGLGNGIQKLGYLPEDTTDFIFAVICEELGLFGALLTIALYAGILWIVWNTIRLPRDSFGRLLAFGIGAMLGLQAAINIAVATVSVPTKGLSLPLVSAGGSGLIITCAALGLLYSITRHVHQEEPIPAPAPKPKPVHDPGAISTSAMALGNVWSNKTSRQT